MNALWALIGGRDSNTKGRAVGSAQVGSQFVEGDERGKHEDLGVAAVRDGDAGVKLPTGVLQRSGQR